MQLLKIISTGFLWILSAAASAAEINVIGTYFPSAADPNSTQFKITVANNECIAVHCKGPDKNFIVGLQNTTVVMPRAKLLNKDSPDEEGGYFKASTSPREVTLINERGDSLRATIKITSLGASLDYAPDNLAELSGSADYLTSNCAASWASNLGTYAKRVYSLKDNQPCVVKLTSQAKDVAHLRYTQLLIGFEIDTLDKPVNLSAGKYTGSYELSVGEQGNEDIYVGKHKQISAENRTITLNFNFTVTHILKVQPIGSTTVYLQPRVGWEAWLANLNTPQKSFNIEGSVNVLLSASGRYQMYLKCSPESQRSTDCELNNSAAGERIMVTTLVVFPPGTHDKKGSGLFLPGWNKIIFTPTRPLSAVPVTINFLITDPTAFMHLYRRGFSSASVDITVVWESVL